jgi:hypothetical protein
MNRQVQSVLVRHAVDLGRLGFSSTSRSVYLYGLLKRDPHGDFKPAQVKGMIEELQSLPQRPFLQFELENWNISFDTGTPVIAKARVPADPVGGDKVHRLDRESEEDDPVPD